MNILFITENFPPETNAAAARVYERAVYWVKWGHRVVVITTAPNFPAGKVFDGYRNRWYQRELIDGIEVVRVKSFVAPNKGTTLRILDFVSFMCSAFVAGIARRRPDVIVATSPQFFAAVGGWGIAAVHRRPFVFELADLWPASIRAVGAIRQERVLGWVEKLELFLYQRSASVVALTSAFKRDLVRRGISRDKIEVIINGVDLTRYAPRDRDRDLAQQWGLHDAFVVGYIGTHGMAHALDNVLDAAILLRHEPKVRILLVGDGAERAALAARVEREGIDNVVMVPRQPKESMPAYWSLCDVALVHLKDDPVFAEVIPSKIFEAMGMGLPILLVSPPGEAQEIVETAAAGQWVPAASPEALAAAIAALAHDGDQVRRLAQESRARAPEFSREQQARAMVETLAQVASGPASDESQPR